LYIIVVLPVLFHVESCQSIFNVIIIIYRERVPTTYVQPHIKKLEGI